MPDDQFRITRRLALAFATAAMLTPATAFAQAAYPAKTITFLCAFQPGGGADTIVRYFAEKISGVAGVSVIVENKPGANGNISAEYTARSRPDGHVVFVHAGTTVAGNMWLLKNPPIDAVKDLKTIATTHKQAMMLTVRADSPYQNLADLVADQKRKGSAGSYATNSTSGIVLAEEFKQQAGIETRRIQYGNSGETLNDMTAGHVDFGVHDPVFSLAQVREGRFRVLGLGTGDRMDATGDIPTFREQGYDIDQLGWCGAMVPAATPDDIVAKLNGWFAEVLSRDETKEFLARAGGEPLTSTPEEAQQLMVDSVAEWKRLVEIAQIEPQ